MLMRRRALGNMAAGAGLLAVACAGAGGAGGAGGAAPAKVACAGRLTWSAPGTLAPPPATESSCWGKTSRGAPRLQRPAALRLRNNTTIMEKLVAAIAGGDPPAVTLVPAQQTPLWTSKGVVQPLDPYARRDKITKDQFVEGYWPQMVIRGKLWRLPFNIDVNFPWFVNRSLFRAAGLNPERMPATVQEVGRAGQPAHPGQPRGAGAARLRAVAALRPGQLVPVLGLRLRGDFYDAGKDKVIADHPKTVAAFEWMAGWARRLGGYDAVEGQLQALGGWGPAFSTASSRWRRRPATAWRGHCAPTRGSR